MIFCGGFASDMTGVKATFLDRLCQHYGWQYTRFDYRGHGQSDGEFSTCGIDDWLADAIAIVDEVCSGPQIVVGSSMGAWIATMLAEKRPFDISGLVCVAAAPDFTEKLLWNNFDRKVKASLESGSVYLLPNHYQPGMPHKITAKLILSGRQLQILSRPIKWAGPARLLHGTSDNDVPFEFSMQLFEQLQGDDVQITLVKDADHRFSDNSQLLLIERSLRELIIHA